MNTNLAALRAMGQSLWLDNITRRILDDGTLARWIDDYGLTGLTSNPTIFDEAIGGSDAYDAGIREKARAGKAGEALFVELALEDLRRAAKLFEPAHDATGGVDGWVSMELSPLLADDTAGSVAAAQAIHDQAACRNLFVKIPGTPAGVGAIEESIFRGVPINVTLLFSTAQYLAAAEAYLRGIERRIAAGLDPVVESVASVFVSRWDKAIAKTAPEALRNGLGIAVGMQCYREYRALLASPRWKTLEAAGARPQRLLWASTSTKDPAAPDTLYAVALAAPDTIDTLPAKTLEAFADHGKAGAPMAVDGGDVEARLKRYADAGIDVDALATQLQEEGAESFVKSWNQLLQRIRTKVETLS
jgi:transaldolase